MAQDPMLFVTWDGTAQHSTAQHSTAQHSSALHCTAISLNSFFHCCDTNRQRGCTYINSRHRWCMPQQFCVHIAGIQIPAEVQTVTWNPWNCCLRVSASSFWFIEAQTSVYTTSAPLTACDQQCPLCSQKETLEHRALLKIQHSDRGLYVREHLPVIPSTTLTART